MANELELNFSGELDNGTLDHTFPTDALVITQGLARMFDTTVPCTTSDTAQTFTNITTLGWVRMKNLDATNYVTYGPTAAAAIVPFGRLKPTEVAYFRLEPGITLRTQANTATCNVHFTVLND